MLRTYRAYDRHGPMGQESDSWDYIKENIDPEDWKWLWVNAVPLGLFRYGHMVRDARVGLEALRDAGHKLILITHRPAMALQDTLEWVTFYFKGVPLDGFHFLSNGEDKSTIEWDLLIDDKVENIEDAVRAGRRAILFDQPWNRDFDEAVLAVPRGNWESIPRQMKYMDRRAA
jgi:5'(3')-deoxyribonucleotidase